MTVPVAGSLRPGTPTGSSATGLTYPRALSLVSNRLLVGSSGSAGPGVSGINPIILIGFMLYWPRGQATLPIPDLSYQIYRILMATTPTPYPVNLLLAGQPVLVVGGGPVAARKVEVLLRAGARVTVVAPAAAASIVERPEVTWLRRRYQPSEADTYRLVVTATNDPAVNARVAADCEAANVFVNSADDPANCTFTLPSVARRGDMQVSVSTGGRSPALARWLRQRIERELDSGYETLLDLLAEARAEARNTFGSSEVAGWNTALDDGLLGLVRVGRTDEARTLLRRHLGLDAPADGVEGAMTARQHPSSDRRLNWRAPASAHLSAAEALVS